MKPFSYRVIAQRKQTPFCSLNVRVKIVEPGVQARKCSLCGQVNHFILEELSMDYLGEAPAPLRLRWMTDAEVDALNEGCESDLDVGDL